MTEFNPTLAGPATLQSVADAAGVHRSTAQRALDPAQRHRISPGVVERVREAAERQGYRRDAAAASLRTGRSRLVGIVLPDLANPVFAPILAGASAALAREGYSLLIAEATGSDDGRVGIVEELISRRIDGLVIATATRRDAVVSLCLERRVPVVLVNRAEDLARATTVVTDDQAGMRLAVEHLVALGHRKIAHLAGPDSLSTGFLRRRGFIAAMEKAGLESTCIVEASAYSREAGERASEELLRRFPDVTAIAAGNDLLALGGYLALARRGIACPRDISIVGHNDMPLADMVTPPLTTVRIGHTTMGEEAARLLIARIADTSLSFERLVLPATLIVRGSTSAR